MPTSIHKELLPFKTSHQESRADVQLFGAERNADPVEVLNALKDGNYVLYKGDIHDLKALHSSLKKLMNQQIQGYLFATLHIYSPK